MTSIQTLSSQAKNTQLPVPTMVTAPCRTTMVTVSHQHALAMATMGPHLEEMLKDVTITVQLMVQGLMGLHLQLPRHAHRI